MKGLIREDEGSTRENYLLLRQKAAATGQSPESVACPTCKQSGRQALARDSVGNSVTCTTCGRVVRK